MAASQTSVANLAKTISVISQIVNNAYGKDINVSTITAPIQNMKILYQVILQRNGRSVFGIVDNKL